MRIKTGLSLSTLLFMFSAASAFAHHGFGRFDMNAEVELSGTLTNLEFVNPHSYVYFDMPLEDGTIRKMGCEMRAATVLRRSGWTRDMFVEGAYIEIVGRPHRDDPASCYVETIAIGESPVLERYQQLDGDEALQADRPMRLSSGEPNISGDWAQEQYVLANLPDGGSAGLVHLSMVPGIASGEMDVSEVPNSGWGGFQVELTQAGEAAAEVLRNEPPEENPRITCQITSILFDWVFDGPINRITQNEDIITIEYGRNLIRTVYLDAEQQPDNIEPSRGGYSVGHWEGDVLVVETNGFLPGRLVRNIPSSNRMTVTERFSLQQDRFDRLVLQRDYSAQDPLYFQGTYEGSDTLLLADAPFAVDECKELASEYLQE